MVLNAREGIHKISNGSGDGVRSQLPGSALDISPLPLLHCLHLNKVIGPVARRTCPRPPPNRGRLAVLRGGCASLVHRPLLRSCSLLLVLVLVLVLLLCVRTPLILPLLLLSVVAFLHSCTICRTSLLSLRLSFISRKWRVGNISTQQHVLTQSRSIGAVLSVCDTARALALDVLHPRTSRPRDGLTTLPETTLLTLPLMAA